MKRLLLFAGLVVVLASCASLPEPESEGNSLVIGSLVLDFPDGYFKEQATRISSGVTLAFRNVTRDRAFTLTTDDAGIFCFLVNGSDEYLFESYKYASEKGIHHYSLGETPIRTKILTVPDRVIYLGHLTVTYAKPALLRTSGDQSSSWDYKTSLSLKWDRDAVLSYIERKQSKSQWLTYELLEYGKK
jgi:hypothetical protein